MTIAKKQGPGKSFAAGGCVKSVEIALLCSIRNLSERKQVATQVATPRGLKGLVRHEDSSSNNSIHSIASSASAFTEVQRQ
jgi:hypothetical protein